MRMKRFLAAGAAFGCGFMIAAKITQGRSGWLIPWPVASSALHPTTAVVLLVSPGCGACNDPSLPLAWAEIVRNVAAQQQEPYRIGVVSSPLPGEGLTFLRQFGEFHEVLAGGGWAGVGSLHFLFRELSGPPAVPQVIVLERLVTRETKGVSVDERVVQRRVGLEEILSWAEELKIRRKQPP